MWVALYINCIYGRFLPVGPFNSRNEANEFCNKRIEPLLWESFEVKSPTGSMTVKGYNYG